MRRALVPVLLLLGLVPVACAKQDQAAPTAAQARQELAGAPRALEGLHAEANRLLGGGLPAFGRRLGALRGHPVVVNKWASWCAPCRFEFPVLRRVSVKLGKRVAFLGLDARDNAAAARRYLKRNPLSYPSYTDPREQISRALKTGQGFPITNFYNRRGRLVFQHAGPYANDRVLEADIRKYIL